MPEVQITIGDRSFDVACQEGEEHYLQAAAKRLDDEARVLSAQIGQIPEARMLLMAGLMLADKTADMQDKLRKMEESVAEKDAELDRLRNAPPPEAERVEVPTVPQSVLDGMSEIAARVEALADQAAT